MNKIKTKSGKNEQENTKQKQSPQPFSSSPQTHPASHLKHPLFQCLSSFTGIGRYQFFFGGFSQQSPTRSPREGWTPVGTRILTPRDGAIKARTMLLGNKGDSRHISTLVTSCPIGMSLPADSSCEGSVSLHFTQSGLSMPAAAGIVGE